MYTIILDQGIVRRDADSKVVSPCESVEDPDFITYIQWVEAGNQPTILDTEPPS